MDKTFAAHVKNFFRLALETVTACKYDLDVGVDGLQADESLFSAHSGHDDIEDDQIDLLVVVSVVFKGIIAVVANMRRIPKVGYNFRFHLGDEGFIINQEDGRLPMQQLFGTEGYRWWRCVGCRQIDGKGGTQPLSALDGDCAMVILDDAVG